MNELGQLMVVEARDVEHAADSGKLALGREYRGWMFVVFLLAAVLRLSLALVNSQSNDDHMEVIRLIRAGHALPVREDCWECFQPKLFHATAAAMLDLARAPTGILEIKLVQLLNAILGCLTLVFVWRFLRLQRFSPLVLLCTFALTALNPKLIGINAQATNDTFAIFLGVVSFYYAYLFLRFRRGRALALASAAIVASALAKTNGLVTFGTVGLALASALVALPAGLRRRMVPYFLAFTLLVPIAITLAPVGQYVQNWRRYGSPVTLNVRPRPAPHFFERTYGWWPGVTSIADSFFTFRLVDMLRYPRINDDNVSYPLHRTSLWSQLYGRAHFVHFDGSPPDWSTDRSAILDIGRMILILALLPTGLLVVGVLAELGAAARAVRRGHLGYFASHPAWVLTLASLSFVSFVVMYAYRYRTFVVMKAVYVYPALLALGYHFAIMLERIERRPGRVWLRAAGAARLAIAGLLLLYVLDVVGLIVQLGVYR